MPNGPANEVAPGAPPTQTTHKVYLQRESPLLWVWKLGSGKATMQRTVPKGHTISGLPNNFLVQQGPSKASKATAEDMLI